MIIQFEWFNLFYKMQDSECRDYRLTQEFTMQNYNWLLTKICQQAVVHVNTYQHFNGWWPTRIFSAISKNLFAEIRSDWGGQSSYPCKDLLTILPTGFRKSVIHQAFRFVSLWFHCLIALWGKKLANSTNLASQPFSYQKRLKTVWMLSLKKNYMHPHSKSHSAMVPWPACPS